MNFLSPEQKNLLQAQHRAEKNRPTADGITSWLHKNQFSFKKPKGTSSKANTDMQEAFIAYYEQLQKNVSAEEPILFGDGVHPSMNTKLAYGWIRTGTNKEIPTSASRTRINLVGSINLKSMDVITTEHDTINSDAIKAHLNKLRIKYPNASKIHLILDQGPYNKSAETKAVAIELGIVLHFLPPYSPNLNSIERLWKVMNEHARNNQFFASAREFRQAISNFFEITWPSIAKASATRINDHFSPIGKKVGKSAFSN